MATLEKFIVENSRFVNFWAREACSTSKKFSELQWFRFDLKLEVLFIKILKKIKVYDFSLKNFVNFVKLGPFSGQSFKISSKGLFDPGPNIIIFEKVKKFQISSMILQEMASNLLSCGHIRPPPTWFRVNAGLQAPKTFLDIFPDYQPSIGIQAISLIGIVTASTHILFLGCMLWVWLHRQAAFIVPWVSLLNVI